MAHAATVNRFPAAKKNLTRFLHWLTRLLVYLIRYLFYRIRHSWGKFFFFFGDKKVTFFAPKFLGREWRMR
jgi:hypothetical protein